jgi:hypothetical protein
VKVEVVLGVEVEVVLREAAPAGLLKVDDKGNGFKLGRDTFDRMSDEDEDECSVNCDRPDADADDEGTSFSSVEFTFSVRELTMCSVRLLLFALSARTDTNGREDERGLTGRRLVTSYVQGVRATTVVLEGGKTIFLLKSDGMSFRSPLLLPLLSAPA